ncbi:hypothetical protein CDAR_81201 [Caerostris darwini]|uniref:Uncharacterized protein n=1 Tax=Caerostris darwini TaxID=1538125 RepID=A0AAV4MGR7_9ARAC|nr:hypothetical protein CDAR_81201 [Caerostris darwini]
MEPGKRERCSQKKLVLKTCSSIKFQICLLMKKYVRLSPKRLGTQPARSDKAFNAQNSKQLPTHSPSLVTKTIFCTLKIKNLLARGEMNGCVAQEGCHGDTENLSQAACQR